MDPTQKKEHNKYNEHDADKAYTSVPITIAVTAITTADPPKRTMIKIISRIQRNLLRELWSELFTNAGARWARSLAEG